jgi:hypothetical protein
MTGIDWSVDAKIGKRKRCYIQARDFFFAAKRCGKTEECKESGMPQRLSVPEYVNIAFSCELYIKTLLYKGEERIKEHTLIKLFDRIDVNLRNKLSDDLKMPIEEIRRLLHEHSQLFSEMRYRFESLQYGESFSIPLQFLYSLAISLDRLAQETIGVLPYPLANADFACFPEILVEL